MSSQHSTDVFLRDATHPWGTKSKRVVEMMRHSGEPVERTGFVRLPPGLYFPGIQDI